MAKVKNPPKPFGPAADGINVSDFTLGDLWRGITRLKLSALSTLIGVLVSALSGVALYTRSLYEQRLEAATKRATKAERLVQQRKQAAETFDDDFSKRFIARNVLQALVEGIQRDTPDGLDTYEETMQALIWQVKSQQGFAEFLAGEQAVTLQVHFKKGELTFDWGHRPSLLPQIMRQLSIEPTPASLRQCNAELNLLGATWLDRTHTAVRNTAGGLTVVTETESDGSSPH